MSLRGLSLDHVREAHHADLIDQIESLLTPFDPPEVETEAERLRRINKTLDEMPQVYRWLLQLTSWCEHWTQASVKMFGRDDPNTQRIRQRQNLMRDMASAAKMRYEGASRSVTTLIEFQPDGMPRSRSG